VAHWRRDPQDVAVNLGRFISIITAPMLWALVGCLVGGSIGIHTSHVSFDVVDKAVGLLPGALIGPVQHSPCG
jgi:hypothetical protein